MRTALRALIDRYLRAAEVALASIQSEFDQQRLLFAWRAGQIPEQGTLSNGQSYRFHGIGCRFVGGELPDIDVELAHDGTVAGFDAWRLYHYSRQLPENCETFESLKAELKSLVEVGELVQKLHDCPHLFALAGAD